MPRAAQLLLVWCLAVPAPAHADDVDWDDRRLDVDAHMDEDAILRAARRELAEEMRRRDERARRRARTRRRARAR
jgi:hypothetical protein